MEFRIVPILDVAGAVLRQALRLNQPVPFEGSDDVAEQDVVVLVFAADRSPTVRLELAGTSM
jgi:hypothetical protein